jgi:signal transduction histidine kinase
MSDLRSPADASQRIAALEAELAAARAEMQAFTATVSHDLRAPLRHITSFAQLLQEEAGPALGDEAQEFLGHITGSAKHLAQMLDALLALSRVGTAPVHLQRVALDEVLTALVQERMRDLQTRQPERTVRWTLAPHLPMVQADASLLSAALGQLLDNAIKFTAQRADAGIDISAHLDPQSGRVHCTVRDNGVGFKADLAVKLFQPFIRLHSSGQFAGLGMGLALARKSLARMGADVAISAAPDAGCSVTVVLPGAS